MAYFQTRIPAPNQVNTFRLMDFTGGLNNRSQQLEDNQASDLLNMNFVDDTIMEKRNGVEYADELILGGAVVFQDWFHPYDAAPIHVRATATELYMGNTKIADVSGMVCGSTYFGKYYFADGNKLRAYGKFLIGDAEDYVKDYDPDDASDYERTIGTVTTDYTVMEIVSPPEGYVPNIKPATYGVWVYDFTNHKAWYEPCEYDLEDTSKGENVVPTDVKFLTSNGDRLFAAGKPDDDDNVFITDISNAFYFPVYLPLQMPPNGDKITGLSVFNGSVIVGRQEDMHVIYGNTNRTDLNGDVFYIKRMNAHIGFANNNCIRQVHNFLFYLGYDGNLYSLMTPKTDVDNLVTTVINQTVDFTKPPFNAVTEDFAKSYATFYKDEYYLVMKGYVVIYNYRHRAFTMHKFQDFDITSIHKKDVDELILGASTGRSLKYSNSYSDLGKPFKAYWTSRSIDVGSPIYEKFFRDMYIISNYYNNAASTVQLRFEVDYSEIESSFNVSNRVAIFGTAVWGDAFISRNITASKPFYLGVRGRTIRITFQNGYDVARTVPTLAELEYLAGVQLGELVYVTETKKYYLYHDYTWIEQIDGDLYQPMKIFEVNGQYEFRGVR